MKENDNPTLSARIEHIRHLSGQGQGVPQYYEAAMLAQTVLHDTIGGSHPLMAALKGALDKSDWSRAVAASRSVIKLFEEGGLTSPRLVIAHEIEGDILDIAQSQVQAAENSRDSSERQVHLALSAFLAGAALEDALRRLCDARGIAYDTQRSSISKLQSALFQPSNQIEVISSSENKQITPWGILGIKRTTVSSQTSRTQRSLGWLSVFVRSSTGTCRSRARLIIHPPQEPRVGRGVGL